jgi:uncharacterized membrane protein YfcA
MVTAMLLLMLFLAAFVAGAQNAVAGGGSFITLPALILTGLDARAANITSTVALFPGQVTTSWAGRKLVAGAGRLSVPVLLGITLIGGGFGACLLLATSATFFARLVPWLVLFATAVFVWGSFIRKAPEPGGQLDPRIAVPLLGAVAVYGGYFGGGIGFLLTALLMLIGQGMRSALGTKNALAAGSNASAVLVFLFSRDVAWTQAAVVAVGAIGGGWCGAWILQRVDVKILRVAVVAIGVALTIGLFLRAP